MKTKMPKKPIILIFFIQVALIALLVILTILGRTIDSIQVGAFFFAIIMGSLGASISLLKRIKRTESKFIKEYEEIDLWAILMPILYGTVLSGVGYLFFMSGILSGDGGEGLLTTNLFPNFTDSSNPNDDLLLQFLKIKPRGIQDAGKLLVWSFISGYSEQFVVKILSELEK